MNPNFTPQWGQTQQPAQAGATPWNQTPAPAPQQFGGGMQNGFAGGPHTPTGPAISLDPESFTTGGMIDNVIVSFSDTKVCMFDYNGKSQSGAVPAIHSLLTIMDAKTGVPLHGATPQPKYWTLGSAADFMPSPDGSQILPLGTKQGLNQTSNGAILIQSLIAAGFPRQVIAAGNVKCLDGLVAFVQNKTRPKNANATADEKENSTLCVSTVYKYPAGIQGGGGAPVPVQQPQPAPVQQFAPPPAPQYAQQYAPQPQPQQQPVAFAPMAAPIPQPQPTQVPAAAPGALTTQQMEMAASILRDVAAAQPTTRGAFNVLVFQKAMALNAGADEGMKALVANPQFQTAMLGAPLNLS